MERWSHGMALQCLAGASVPASIGRSPDGAGSSM